MAALQEEPSVHQALDRALRYLAVRPRSQAEVRRYLLKHFPSDTVALAIVRLQEQRLLDDAAFAHAWVRSRLAHRPRSSALMAREMAAHGVPREAIQEALAEIDDEGAASVALRGFLKRRSIDDPEERRRRAWQHLHRRGFSPSVIRRALDHLGEEAGSDSF